MAVVKKRKLVINGREYLNPVEEANDAPVWVWTELQEQSGISLDQFDTGQMNWRLFVVGLAFVIRHRDGEEITWEQALRETNIAKQWLEYEVEEDDADDGEDDTPPVADGIATISPSAA